jgi:hypothetical protein
LILSPFCNHVANSSFSSVLPSCFSIKGTLTLNFDEPVRAVSASVVEIYAQGVIDASSSANIFRLTSGTVSTINGRQIVIQMTQADINGILELPKVFQDLASSYVSFASSFINDMAGNSVAAVTSISALAAQSYTSDSTVPRLSSFDLNMDGATAYLTLTFTEPVDSATLDVTKLVIQSAANVAVAANQHRLTGGTVTTPQHHAVLTLALSSADLDALKLKQIALTDQTSWLTMDLGAVNNLFDLGVSALENGSSAISVTQYTADTTKPTIESFKFDMNSGKSHLSIKC